MGIVGAVLGVIVGLFVIAWTTGMFGDATSGLDEARAFELVSRLRAEVKAAYLQESTYGADADLVPTLTAMGKVPGSARGPSDTIVSPYGGDIKILGDGRRFHISVEEIGDSECLNIAKRFSGAAAADFGVVNIEVTDAEVDEVNDDAPDVPTLAEVQTACAEGADANYLTMTFR